MIEVELPDGAIAEFPEGTPRATIEAALQRRIGAELTGPKPEQPSSSASPAMGPRRIPQPQPELIVDEHRSDAQPFPKHKPPRVLLRRPR